MKFGPSVTIGNERDQLANNLGVFERLVKDGNPDCHFLPSIVRRKVRVLLHEIDRDPEHDRSERVRSANEVVGS